MTNFLPLLKDEPAHDHHGNVKGVEGHKPNSVVDIDVASPEKIERPEGSKHVKDDVPQERTLSQRKWLGDGHRANHYCSHKYPST